MSQVSGGRRRRRIEEQSLERELLLQEEEMRKSEQALQDVERNSTRVSGRHQSNQRERQTTRLLESDDEAVTLRNKLRVLQSAMTVKSGTRYKAASPAQTRTRRSRAYEPEQNYRSSSSSSSSAEVRELKERVTKLEEENKKMIAKQCGCSIS